MVYNEIFPHLYRLHHHREFGDWDRTEVDPRNTTHTFSALRCGTNYQFYIQASQSNLTNGVVLQRNSGFITAFFHSFFNCLFRLWMTLELVSAPKLCQPTPVGPRPYLRHLRPNPDPKLSTWRAKENWSLPTPPLSSSTWTPGLTGGVQFQASS